MKDYKIMKYITKTIRITRDQELFLISGYKNINQGVLSCIDQVRKDANGATLELIRQYSIAEIKGKFSREEWLFLIDSLNGTITTDRFRCIPSVLAAHCEDAAGLDGLDSKWDVDMATLLSKITTLTSAQLDAIYSYIEEFWDSEERDLEKTATQLV